MVNTNTGHRNSSSSDNSINNNNNNRHSTSSTKSGSTSPLVILKNTFSSSIFRSTSTTSNKKKNKSLSSSSLSFPSSSSSPVKRRTISANSGLKFNKPPPSSTTAASISSSLNIINHRSISSISDTSDSSSSLLSKEQFSTSASSLHQNSSNHYYPQQQHFLNHQSASDLNTTASPIPSMTSDDRSWLESPEDHSRILPMTKEQYFHDDHNHDRQNSSDTLANHQSHDSHRLNSSSSSDNLNRQSSSYGENSNKVVVFNLQEQNQKDKIKNPSIPTPPPFVPIQALIQYQHSLSFDLNTNMEFAADWRDKDFHEKFPEVPLDEKFIEEYHSASREDVLVQGKLYISQHHICFRSTVLPHKPIIISFYDIIDLQLKTTAKIPNSISIETESTYYFFSNFIHRNEAWTMLNVLWDFHVDKKSKYRLQNRCKHATETVCSKCIQDVDGIRHAAPVRNPDIFTQRKQNTNTSSNSSTISPNTFTLPHNSTKSLDRFSPEFSPRLISPSAFIGSSKQKSFSRSETNILYPQDTNGLKRSKSLRVSEMSSHSTTLNQKLSLSQNIEEKEGVPQAPPTPEHVQIRQQQAETSSSTEDLSFTMKNCECGDLHTSRQVLIDHVFPCSLDDVFRFMFSVDKEGFQKRFLYEKRGLKNVQITKWSNNVIEMMAKVNVDECYISNAVLDQNTDNLQEGDARIVEYILPLNNPLARQTKCITEQKIVSICQGHFVCVEARTRTPDVPSGDAFASVNRYCLTRVSSNQTKVVGSFQLEWSKGSWFKSQIEKSSLAGNKKTYEMFMETFEEHLQNILKHQLSSQTTTNTPNTLDQMGGLKIMNLNRQLKVGHNNDGDDVSKNSIHHDKSKTSTDPSSSSLTSSSATQRIYHKQQNNNSNNLQTGEPSSLTESASQSNLTHSSSFQITGKHSTQNNHNIVTHFLIEYPWGVYLFIALFMVLLSMNVILLMKLSKAVDLLLSQQQQQ